MNWQLQKGSMKLAISYFKYFRTFNSNIPIFNVSRGRYIFLLNTSHKFWKNSNDICKNSISVNICFNNTYQEFLMTIWTYFESKNFKVFVISYKLNKLRCTFTNMFNKYFLFKVFAFESCLFFWLCASSFSLTNRLHFSWYLILSTWIHGLLVGFEFIKKIFSFLVEYKDIFLPWVISIRNNQIFASPIIWPPIFFSAPN